MENSIKLLIISKNPLVSNLLASYLADEPGVEVIRTAAAIQEVISGPQDFEMLLINAELPDRGALELAEFYSSRKPAPHLLVFNLANSRSQILEYIEAGIDGYLLKDQSIDHLVEIILLISEDKTFISPKIAAAVMKRLNTLANLMVQFQSLVDFTDSLTLREEEVLHLLSAGKTNQEIADELVIALGTAKNHVHSIFQKLNVKNRQEAAVYWSLIQQKKSPQVKTRVKV